MHADEVHIDVALVQRLVAEQFPALAGSSIRELPSTGTVNAIYRIGNDACARLPRVAAWTESLQREARWLPWLAERLPMVLPEPLGTGRPGASYPFGWAIYRWIEAEPYSEEAVGDEAEAARALARFVLDLRRLDPAGAPAAGRRPLAQLDVRTHSLGDSAREA